VLESHNFVTMARKVAIVPNVSDWKSDTSFWGVFFTQPSCSKTATWLPYQAVCME